MKLHICLFLLLLIKGTSSVCDLGDGIKPFGGTTKANFSNVFAIADRMRIPCDSMITSVTFGTNLNGGEFIGGPVFQIWRPHPSFEGVFVSIAELTPANSTWSCSRSNEGNICSTSVAYLACASDALAFQVSPAPNPAVLVASTATTFNIYTTDAAVFPTLHTGFLEIFSSLGNSPYVTIQTATTQVFGGPSCVPLPASGPQGFLDFSSVRGNARVLGHMVVMGPYFNGSGYIRQLKVGTMGSGVLAVNFWSPLGNSYIIEPTSIRVSITDSIVHTCLENSVLYPSGGLMGFHVVEGNINIGFSTSATWLRPYTYLAAIPSRFAIGNSDWSTTFSGSSPLVYLNTEECSRVATTGMDSPSSPPISTPELASSSLEPSSTSNVFQSLFQISISSSLATSVLLDSNDAMFSTLITSLGFQPVDSTKQVALTLVSSEFQLSASVSVSVPTVLEADSGLPIGAVVAIAIVGFLAGVVVTSVVLSVVFCRKQHRKNARKYDLRQNNVRFVPNSILTNSIQPLIHEPDERQSPPPPGVNVVMQVNPSYAQTTHIAPGKSRKETEPEGVVMISNPAYTAVEHAYDGPSQTLGREDDSCYDYVDL